MSDVSQFLGLDNNKPALNLINGIGQSLALNAGQQFLNNQNIPINLQQFVPTAVAAPQQVTVQLDPTIEHNGLKTVFHALIEGAPTTGLTVAQYIASIEARLDAWVDSIG